MPCYVWCVVLASISLPRVAGVKGSVCGQVVLGAREVAPSGYPWEFRHERPRGFWAEGRELRTRRVLSTIPKAGHLG